MFIAVDALAISRESAGSFTVLTGLMKHLPDGINARWLFLVNSEHVEKALREINPEFMFYRAPRKTVSVFHRTAWQYIRLPHILKEKKCDLLYSASGYPHPTSPIPVVSHQQNLWSFSESQSWWDAKTRIKAFLRRMVAGKALRTSVKNIFISEYLKAAADEKFPNFCEKNVVVSNAISSEDIQPRNPDDVNENYIISVSSVAPHKNYPALLKSIALVRETIPDIQLKIIGNYTTPYGQNVMRQSHDLGLRSNVGFLGYRPLEDIYSLFQKAKFSINVSLLEGFGLSVLESMAVGCPVICPETTAFPEICGQAALYCDPDNIQDIAEKICKLYNDPVLQTQLSGAGIEQAGKFTWERSAQLFWDVIQGI